MEEEGCAQEPTEDHGPDEGEDLGRPVAEMEGRAAPASPEPGSELGAPERNDPDPWIQTQAPRTMISSTCTKL